MIRASELTFSYSKRKRKILDGFSLEIKEGEIFALLGPNGVGKSTAISLLSGARKPNSGCIEIDGININEIKLSEKTKYIGIVEQNPEFDNLSIYDSILLGRLANFMLSPCKHDRYAANTIIQTLGLEDIATHPVNELSGGERQLVAIGRALVKEPKFLLLDEPTSNLDLANKLSILRLIKKAAKENGVSILICLHDLNEAIEIADRFAFIKDGKCVTCSNKYALSEELISDIYGVKVSLVNNDGQIHLFIKEDI